MDLINLDPKARVIPYRRKMKKMAAQLASWETPEMRTRIEKLASWETPEMRTWIEKLAAQTRRFQEMGDRLLSPEERRRKEFEKKERQHWAEVAQTMRTTGYTRLYHALRVMGPRVWAEPEVQAELQKLCNDALDDEDARKLLKKLCPPLAALDTGRPELATEEERQQNKRKSKLQNTQTKRAREYADKALQCFHAKIENLKERGLLDVDTAREAAEDIAEEEFSRGKGAKEQAKHLFWKQVDQEWPKH